MALLSLLVAVLAVAISTVTALRQIRVATSSTHIAVAIDVLRQRLDGDFLESERFVRTNLARTPPQPIATLPTVAREHVIRVATVYQMIGYLAATKAVDPEIMHYMFGVNAVRSWRSLWPFIEAQRTADAGDVGYRFFEDLAFRCSKINAAVTTRRFDLHAFDDGGR